uniref:Dimethylglycine dehydrogenase n=1 Tax=Timema tahoe TaxID=61484 RepID=A0A7R9FI20_9NEOP|nr:unnamed protein product [Timema tahoe]
MARECRRLGRAICQAVRERRWASLHCRRLNTVESNITLTGECRRLGRAIVQAVRERRWASLHCRRLNTRKQLFSSMLPKPSGGSCSRASSALCSPSDDCLPDGAHTVIIGGGAVGCSIAYHLAKLGQKGVILLERSELTAGSTWHAAGLTALYHPTPNLKSLHYYSINLYSQLSRETGQEVSFHQPGSIRLATSPDRVDEFSLAYMSCALSQVLAGLFNPGDGHIDPYSLTQALATGARRYGAQLRVRSEVTGLQRRPQGGWDVHTKEGRVIRTLNVVNAAGFWAREVGSMAGLDLPLVPVEHQYMVTAPIPDVKRLQREIPVLRHLDGSFYLRQEREDCLVVGPYESPDTMKTREDWLTRGVPPGFGKELFPSDVERLSPHLDAAMELVPSLKTASVKSVVCGPITYTPDVLPMVGPTLLPNMWLAVGFSYGIVHAGCFGRFLAEWLLTGEPPCEVLEVDPLRYGSWTDLPFALAKVRESYGLNTAITYPKEERFAGRPTRRVSGVYETLVQRGAHMGFQVGWEHPSWFAAAGGTADYCPSFYRTNWHEAVKREWELVMNNIGVIDLSPSAKFILSGDDSFKFLQYVTANAIPPSKVYSELTVTSLGEGRYLLVSGGSSELHDLRWLEDHARRGGYHVTLSNVTDSMGCLGVAGPRSGQLLGSLSEPGHFDSFPFLSARKIVLGDVLVTALRISYTGELGWELYCDQHSLLKLYNRLMEVGQEHGAGDFGSYAMNVLRMEKGFRMWGSDMNKDTSLLEAGLGRFVKLDKSVENKNIIDFRGWWIDTFKKSTKSVGGNETFLISKYRQDQKGYVQAHPSIDGLLGDVFKLYKGRGNFALPTTPVYSGKGDFVGRTAVLQEKRQGLQTHLVTLAVNTDNVDPIGDESVYCAGKEPAPSISVFCWSEFLAADPGSIPGDFGVFCKAMGLERGQTRPREDK